MDFILEIVKKYPEFKYPGPRFRNLGQQSGEEFRENYFIPWLDDHLLDPNGELILDIGKLILDVDGFVAYPPSFFKEFILGTAENNDKYKDILKNAEIHCTLPRFKKRIEEILSEIT